MAPPALSLLEVVLSVVMLGLVAASVTGAISAIEAMTERNRRMLAAYELANRLILTHLDNPKSMPPSSLPLDYGPYTFMWDSAFDTVEMKINETQKRTAGASPQALDRFELISITIFEAEGEGPQPREGQALATLTRMYDPAAGRNPESAKNIADLDNLGRIIERIGGGARLPRSQPKRGGSGN